MCIDIEIPVMSGQKMRRQNTFAHGFFRLGNRRPSIAVNAGRYLTATLLACAMTCPAAWALPTGWEVVSGDVSFETAGNTLNITSASHSAIVNYQSFNIAGNETVNFNFLLSGSSILNRIIGGGATSIAGNLNANGNVLLVNPAGIHMAQTANLNVGSMVASTLNISNADYLAGQYVFFRDPGYGATAVRNDGTIQANAADGKVVLMGSAVYNNGVISASEAALAVGEKITVGMTPEMQLNVTVDSTLKEKVEAYQSAIDNAGTLTANRAELKADVDAALFDSVVNNSGRIQALGAYRDGPEIVLAGRGGLVENSGTIDGAGGDISISGDRIIQAGTVQSNASEGGTGGDLLISSTENTILASGSVTSANGGSGTGNAGNIIIWSDQDTDFQSGAVLDVSGGQVAGNAGFAEVSGQETVYFNGHAKGGATDGQAGRILIDPTDITISNGGTYDPRAGRTFDGFADITLQATRDIRVSSAFDTAIATGNTGVNLTMEAGNHITISAPVSTTNANITLVADADNSGAGNISISSAGSVTATGGMVTMSGRAISSSGNISGDNVNLTSAHRMTLNADVSATNALVASAGERFYLNGNGSLSGNSVQTSSNGYSYLDGAINANSANVRGDRIYLYGGWDVNANTWDLLASTNLYVMPDALVSNEQISHFSANHFYMNGGNFDPADAVINLNFDHITFAGEASANTLNITAANTVNFNAALNVNNLTSNSYRSYVRGAVTATGNVDIAGSDRVYMYAPVSGQNVNISAPRAYLYDGWGVNAPNWSLSGTSNIYVQPDAVVGNNDLAHFDTNHFVMNGGNFNAADAVTNLNFHNVTISQAVSANDLNITAAGDVNLNAAVNVDNLTVNSSRAFIRQAITASGDVTVNAADRLYKYAGVTGDNVSLTGNRTYIYDGWGVNANNWFIEGTTQLVLQEGAIVSNDDLAHFRTNALTVNGDNFDPNDANIVLNFNNITLNGNITHDSLTLNAANNVDINGTMNVNNLNVTSGYRTFLDGNITANRVDVTSGDNTYVRNSLTTNSFTASSGSHTVVEQTVNAGNVNITSGSNTYLRGTMTTDNLSVNSGNTTQVTNSVTAGNVNIASGNSTQLRTGGSITANGDVSVSGNSQVRLYDGTSISGSNVNIQTSNNRSRIIFDGNNTLQGNNIDINANGSGSSISASGVNQGNSLRFQGGAQGTYAIDISGGNIQSNLTLQPVTATSNTTSNNTSQATSTVTSLQPRSLATGNNVQNLYRNHTLGQQQGQQNLIPINRFAQDMLIVELEVQGQVVLKHKQDEYADAHNTSRPTQSLPSMDDMPLPDLSMNSSP